MKTTYRVKFDRVGRNHCVAPLDVHFLGGDSLEAIADTLSERVLDYARRYLDSPTASVTFDPDKMAGLIVGTRGLCGKFTAAPVPSAR